MLQDCNKVTIFVNNEDKVEAIVVNDAQYGDVLALDIQLLERTEFVIPNNRFVQLAFKTGFNAFEEYIFERINYKL